MRWERQMRWKRQMNRIRRVRKRKRTQTQRATGDDEKLVVSLRSARSICSHVRLSWQRVKIVEARAQEA